ncbi:g850 [Coccomyxa elongata]
MVLEEEQARESAREAAEQAAEHAARLEPVLAAGCGVCGIRQYRSEALMQLHERSGRHNRAVAREAQAAEAAEEAAVAAENAVNSNNIVNAADRPSSSTDLVGDGDNSDEDGDEDGEDVDDRDRVREDLDDGEHVLADNRRGQSADPVSRCSVPDHIQAVFEANKFEQPETGAYIRAGLTDDQVSWYDALQVARYSVSEKYPVDLDEMWQTIGFSRKDAAVRYMKANLTPDMHFVTSPLASGGATAFTGKQSGQSYGPAPDQYALTLEAAQHLAMGAPGTNGRKVRDMYIRVVQRVQDYEILTRLYASFESARQAHHDAIVANVTDKRCAYLSQIMLVNGEKRRKGGYTDDTPKGRYTNGLKEQFGTGPSRFLYDRVAVVCNPREVEQSLLTRSAFTRRVHPVTLPNGNLTTETFSVEGMTVKQTHREFDRIVKEYGKTAQLISEDERREIRQHEIKMKEIDRDIEVAREANRSKEIDRDIEVAREANRSKELDIELRKLQMGDEHRLPRGIHTVPRQSTV